jgi:predicted dehydrogenase
LAGVADCRVDAAQRIGERMRCRSYDRVEHMLADCRLDAAVVCTPPATHADICVSLMEHGIHVLCEKPFSTDVSGAQKMQASAQQAGVRLTMASKFRYVEDVIQARSMIASGMLGDLILFENVFACNPRRGTSIDHRQRCPRFGECDRVRVPVSPPGATGPGFQLSTSPARVESTVVHNSA